METEVELKAALGTVAVRQRMAMETVMEQRAAVAVIYNESKQHTWLENVCTHVKMENRKSKT